jgi:hypothetical protein
LGKRDRRALSHQLTRIIEHLLKLQYSRAEESRAGWENSVDVHRSRARKIVTDSPGLRGHLEDMLSESYEDSHRRAERSLRGEPRIAAAWRRPSDFIFRYKAAPLPILRNF